jgi:hypothetical protein
MSDDPPPVNGNLWGAWNKGAVDRWNTVHRSWNVFARNTTELINHLKVPATNIVFSLQLMGDDRDATQPFWDELDQRLHNQLASAVSLVDHTRRLLKYYESEGSIVADYGVRNDALVALGETGFLRDFRNYLVHYGLAPTIQVMSLGPINEVGMTGHSIKLSSEALLKWDKWNSRSRKYLESFKDGPVLGMAVSNYANAMCELFTWLFAQRAPYLATPPERFRMDVPPEGS